jgi:formate hydrogenlyase subunit 4
MRSCIFRQGFASVHQLIGYSLCSPFFSAIKALGPRQTPTMAPTTFDAIPYQYCEFETLAISRASIIEPTLMAANALVYNI